MKRSQALKAPIAAVVLAAAAMLSGCDLEPEPEQDEFSRICVDEEIQRRDDDDCNDSSSIRFHWFYIHSSHPVPAVGSKVTAPGSYVRPATGIVGNVSRGGFGGKASGGS